MKSQRNKTDKIIFDLDGVITSEYMYWQAAALTVYELLYSYEYYGKQDIDREWCRKNVNLIYDTIFCGEKTIRGVKRLGVNTNWDLAYVTFCISRYLDPSRLDTFDSQYFESVCMFIENMELHPPELYVGIEGLVATVVPKEVGFFKRGADGLWQELNSIFDRWLFGDDEVQGLTETEEPILPVDEIKKTLLILKEKGYKLGIGTGRPKKEAEYPLKKWGLYDLFEKDMIATYDEVKETEERQNNGIPLAKPHPFIFQKAAFGNEFSETDILKGEIPKERQKECLVIGDALSDYLGAKAAGFAFGAVLTGVEGEGARPFFEEVGADLIYSSILDLIEYKG